MIPVKAKTIAMTCYPITDMARSRRFYEDVLGLVPTISWGENFQEYDLDNGTFAIGRLPADAPDYYKNRASSLTFEMNDLPGVLESLKAQQVPILSEILEFPTCRMFAIADPDNNVITLHEQKPQ